MKPNYLELVSHEIRRLESLGWSDVAPDKFGLRNVVKVPESEISFPQKFYDRDKTSQEAEGIWVNWRVREVLRIMKRHDHKLIWEVGSGDGNIAIPLYSKNVGVIGIEPLIDGAIMTSKSGIRTYLGTLESLNLPSNSIFAVGAFDVLEHLENPKKILEEIYRVLKPGGSLLVSVPAHQWLFSDYDSSIGHHRRYSKKFLIKSLKEVGFDIVSSRFMFSIFVPAAILLRRLPYLLGRNQSVKSTIDSCSKQSKLIRIFNPILIVVLYLEDLVRLPFGLSIFCVSKKETLCRN